jgi:hypothetical protein
MTHYGNHPIGFMGVSMVTASLGANDPEPGYRMTVGDEDYIFVYNAGGSAIGVSYGATVSAVTGYSVTVSSLTGVDPLVGVCVNTSIGAAEYGWLVTKGFATIEMGAAGSAPAGSLLCLGTDGAFAFKSNSTGHPGPTVGKAMETIAASASGVAYISVS